MGRVEMKKESLRHYDRMIAYAETCNKKDAISKDKMRNSIGECWLGSSCKYCEAFLVSGTYACPLSSPDTLCYRCCSGKWAAMDNSDNWKHFVVNATVVRKYIEDNG